MKTIEQSGTLSQAFSFCAPEVDDKGRRHRYLRPGELFVASSPHIITTVLGSCVSVCMWDPVRRIGGMNHFMLPRCGRDEQPSNKYGDVAISALLERMINHGASPEGIEAIVSGGGNLLQINGTRQSIGHANVECAIEVLTQMKMNVQHCYTGLQHGRKLMFDTLEGSVRISSVASIRQLPEGA